jgi:hypothetical protein
MVCQQMSLLNNIGLAVCWDLPSDELEHMKCLIQGHQEALALAEDLMTSVDTDTKIWDDYHSAYAELCCWLRNLDVEREQLKLSTISISEIPEKIRTLQVRIVALYI